MNFQKRQGLFDRRQNERILALDFGGTWLKGVCLKGNGGNVSAMGEVARIPNPLVSAADAGQFADAVLNFCLELTQGESPAAMVAATAGEVDAAGRRYLCAGGHLGVMGSSPWVDRVADALKCPFRLINDAEAFVLGAAQRGVLPTQGNVGSLVIGTGLGFCLVRDGRWWKPSRRLIHLGAAFAPEENFDRLVSMTSLVEEGGLTSDSVKYFDAVAAVAASAVNLFRLDTVLLGGGAVDAARSVGVDLAERICGGVKARLLPGLALPRIVAMDFANRVILEGALALAAGDLVGETLRFEGSFAELATEASGEELNVEETSADQMIHRLAEEEAAASERFLAQIPLLTRGAEMSAKALQCGGRVIYLGAGTSGRLGALDAVEIPCTFGLSRDRFVAVIAGGVSDVALTIEDQFEEDTSSVADLMLLRLQPEDIVVGISASGSAYFVRSGLGYARSIGASTILIHEGQLEKPLADLEIALKSGRELIAGSTRMKAGTATKKALNILSTGAMFLMGRVCSGEMTDMYCCNEKLRKRAVRILTKFGNLGEDEARDLLEKHHWQLRAALDCVERKSKIFEEGK